MKTSKTTPSGGREGEVRPPEADSFAPFALPEELLRALDRMEIRVPTPIQVKAIPVALEGRDLIGCAQTGTGKSLAFCLPMLCHVLSVRKKTSVVLAPTRELANQIQEVLANLCKDLPQIVSTVIIGGEHISKQRKRLSARPRPQILVATPGRLQDLIDQGLVRPEFVDYVVLDEADRMLDMGFLPQIRRILDRVPAERTTQMFSATMPPELEKLAARFLRNPERVFAGPVSRPVDKIRQSAIPVTQANKKDVLLEELDRREGSVVVFLGSKHRTTRLHRFLVANGHSVTLLHGGRSQYQREQAIRGIQQGDFRILVATDIASRGLDIPRIDHVVNFDLPRTPEDYVHRIGRTARAGAEGEAVAFLTSGDAA